MIKKEDYKKAREIIKEYEQQLDLSVVSDSTCWIMNRTSDNLVFVITDKDYAERLYESGDYTMRISKIINII